MTATPMLAEAGEIFRPHWAAVYGRHRTEHQAGRQEGKSLAVRLTGWLSEHASPDGASLPFLRQNLRAVASYAKGQFRRQQSERAELGARKRTYAREAIVGLKQDYARALGRLLLRHDIQTAGQGPAAALEPITLTAEQQRALELSRAAGASTKPRSKDRDYEP